MRRFLIEVGMGADFHKPDPTKCAVRAVKDTIYRCTLVGLYECKLISSMKDMRVKVKISVPFPDQVDKDEVLEVIPFGQKEIAVESGGLMEDGHLRKDGSRDKIMVAVAAITVMVP